jgi:hypothetical protein
MRGKSRLAVLGLAVGFALSGPATTVGATTIDTTAGWNGFLDICAFGAPNTATYGQVVRVPATDTVLGSYTFYLRQAEGPGALTFRGEVYAWDGLKATGPNLWESAPRTLTVQSGFEALDFDTGGVQLAAGQQYVLFATISKDYEQNNDTSRSCWGYRYQDAYNGGGFVYLNNFGDQSEWTTTPWETFVGNGVDDLAFKASLSKPLPTSKNECKSGGWRSYGVFKNQGDCVSFVATKGKNPPANPSR